MKLSKSCTHVFSIRLYVNNSSFLNKRWKKNNAKKCSRFDILKNADLDIIK